MADQHDPRRLTGEFPAVWMSAFAMLFFHYPSLVDYQRRMQQRTGRSHRERVVQVEEPPSATPRREIRDGVPTEPLRPVLPQTVAPMRPLVQGDGVSCPLLCMPVRKWGCSSTPSRRRGLKYGPTRDAIDHDMTV